MKNIKYVIALLFCFMVVYSYAENNYFNLRFKQIKPDKNSLNNGYINTIYQDNRGFMWFATPTGLFRYDGYKIKAYYSLSSDTNSLTSSNVLCIAEDRDSNLWIGTDNGLNKFLYKEDKFIRYSQDRYPFVKNNYITSLAINKNILWIGTAYGLATLNLFNFDYKIFTSKDIPKESNNSFISAMEKDFFNNVYILTNNGNFIKYHGLSNQFILIQQLSNSLPFSKQDFLFNFKDSLIIVIFDQYVYEYEISSNSFKQLYIDNKPLKGPYTSICADENDKLWIVSTYKDLLIFDINTKKTIRHLLLDGINEWPTDRSGFKYIFRSKDDILWFGSYDNGISYYHPKLFKFQSIIANENLNKGLSSNYINAIYETSNKEILIGHEHGLQLFNRDKSSFEPIKSIGNIPVLSIFEDSKKNVWVTTYTGKIFFRRNKNNYFQYHPLLSLNISRAVRSIAEDNSGNLWFATMGSGVYRYNGFTVNDFQSATGYSLPNLYVNAVFFDKENNLWIATSHGIAQYNSQKYKTYLQHKNTIFLNVRTIFQDSQHRVWFGYPNGLLVYIPEKDSVFPIAEPTQLQKNYILGITEDDEKYLWLTSNFGLIKVMFDKNLRCQTFQYFYNSDGLPDNFYRPNALCKLSDNTILLGTNNGIGIIPFSYDYKGNFKTVPLYFTTLKVFNTEVGVNKTHVGRVILRQSLTELPQIVLTHKHNIFSIEFASLYYLNPQMVRYQYKLQGLDTNWIQSEPNFQLATYTNLPSGKYTLHVKAEIEKQIIAEKQIDLIILPPFWKSNWAKAIYVLVLFLCILLLRYAVRKTEQRKLAIIKEKEEAQRIHNLDMLKINFFTNISHELRTPLTLIISPLEKIFQHKLDPIIENHLQIIKKNSYRLLQLVNQLLDFRKLDAYGLSFNPSMNDIVSFTREIVLSFTDMAEIKDIKYLFNTNIQELVMEYDAEKYEKILFNLLSNAFKYTHENGMIAVELNFHEEINISSDKPVLSGQLILKVKDNGIGIPDDMKERIFEQFVQGNNIHSTFIHHGSGIGLALVKEYVRLHKGDIKLESQVGVGSCFSVIIPVIKSSVKVKVKESTEQMVLSNDETNNEPLDQKYPSMLIVEDNEELRFYLKDNFKSKYRIFEANNGQQGFSIASQIIPDIIISDIMIPILDGIALCKKLKSTDATSHIPVILLTALNTSESQLAGIEAGADDYIVKPFNFKILEAKINQLVEKQLQKQNAFASKINIEPKEIAITSLDEKFIHKALDIVEKHMADSSFTVEAFSAEMGMSRMLLYKKIMTLTGKSPVEFIRTLRMKRAAQLLIKSQLNVSEIAYQVGFNDAKYFSQCFKKEFNLLPSEFKKNMEIRKFNI